MCDQSPQVEYYIGRLKFFLTKNLNNQLTIAQIVSIDDFCNMFIYQHLKPHKKKKNHTI